MIKKYLKKIFYGFSSFFIVIFSVLATVYVYASFVEHISGPGSSDQDFVQNILGANNANNDFDSSSVLPNNDGSIIERAKYLSNIARRCEIDTIFYVGGNTYYCKKRVIDSDGQVAISNINEGMTCDAGKTCSSGDCL